MEFQAHHYPFERRPAIRDRTPAVRWCKEWIPQELVATGGKCSLLKWVREDKLKALEEKAEEPKVEEPKPEPTTEVLFLCSYEGCGKTFIDVGALRKHAHIHGEKQHVCHFEGCGKKFLDSSKLKRHFLIHTGERDFVCPHEGCGKAFSLDFNLRAHMKTHSLENYHVCPYPECGKRYTNECKLRTHIKTQHEKNTAIDAPKHTPPAEKVHTTPKTPAPNYASATSDRPYACPYDGCGKAYIHEYKLNLHLRREHPNHNSDENIGKNTPHTTDEAESGAAKTPNPKRKHNPVLQKAPPAKIVRKTPNLVPPTAAAAATNSSIGNAKKQWASKEVYEEEEEDSEETEEDRDNIEEGWRNREANGDDEETEDED
uniref:C2H2-type domain-containing protein n=1 Tax=Ananas comosus var. bracteatus TaxID=296719 RepID=A0A6V7P187_ANACO|nr:unnamed protein product [Ananas comosus var. bracteatus]